MSYALALYIASLGLAYQTRFAEATLLIGRSLSKSGEPTGFQGAVTPPIATYLYLAIWILSVTTLGAGFYLHGPLIGIAALAGFWVMVAVNRMFVLPKSDSIHFRSLILASMVKRHADYSRDGDKLRADAMAVLLKRAGLETGKFQARLVGELDEPPPQKQRDLGQQSPGKMYDLDSQSGTKLQPGQWIDREEPVEFPPGELEKLLRKPSSECSRTNSQSPTRSGG